MGHIVTSADSDYFEGYCECSQLPCLSCVAAQGKLERREALRGALLSTYFKHHRVWPQGAFTDDIIGIFARHVSSAEVITDIIAAFERADRRNLLLCLLEAEGVEPDIIALLRLDKQVSSEKGHTS